MMVVTGSAGFIGFHLAKRLLDQGYVVVGIDNMNDFYDVNLKIMRNDILRKYPSFTFLKKSILEVEKKDIKDAEVIFHEAAYAGVRTSVDYPMLYNEMNVAGTVHLLDRAVKSGVKKFLFASSSSVYGNVEQHPTPETHPTNPLSPYGVSKLAAEKYCNAFFTCYGLPAISFRYFTVYGPHGRPDMLMLKIIQSCFDGKPFARYVDNGNPVAFSRDFSYIDDVVEVNIRAMESVIKNDVFNVGAGNPVSVEYVKNVIEKITQKKSVSIDSKPNAADPLKTHADISHLKEKLHVEPKVSIDEGIKRTVDWYMKK